MTDILIDLKAARKSLADSQRLVGEGKNEQVVRDSFTSYLRQIFPAGPNWIDRHIHGSEAAIKIISGGKRHTGFVDNLIDLTVIEYEADLTIVAKFNEGLSQVRKYCAGLINAGQDPDLIIGILSDTLRWRAFAVDPDHIENLPVDAEAIGLIELEVIDCSDGSETSAENLTRFLVKYLGREGARPLSADSIAKDLGFGSAFSEDHIRTLTATISDIFRGNPRYGSLIAELWSAFVGYLQDDEGTGSFDLVTYVDEYYVVTLAKLLCANILEERGIYSNDQELYSIMDGRFFENKGLQNVVEYDYFGWLNMSPSASALLPVARMIQKDLSAYDFTSRSQEDLFGKLFAQLANRSKRILLGQEWTPSWVSEKLVKNVVRNIDNGTPMRLIDMCCGSGSMVVEAVKIAKHRITEHDNALPKGTKIGLLIEAITGFDIDPLAVILSKINWVIAAADWLMPFGSHPLSIPIYHADSLFAITPITGLKIDNTSATYTLNFAGQNLLLPEYLISPKFRSLFDALTENAYEIAISTSGTPKMSFTLEDAGSQVESLLALTHAEVTSEQIDEITIFHHALVCRIDHLNRDGRNGIWSYILRNSFRPGLVLGQFNGLVSNPPWLALSKLANNPYKDALRKLAFEFNIKPAGSSHLHIELATIFLLHAVDAYLTDGAAIGCVVPDTVLNGHQHNPFRTFQYLVSSRKIRFNILNIWKIGDAVFKNKAVILFGKKEPPNTQSSNPIVGRIIHQSQPDVPTNFYQNTQGNRTIWSEADRGSEDGVLFVPADFRQGADIMPRTLLFFDVQPATSGQIMVKSIDPLSSSRAFLISDAKLHKDFHLSPRILPSDLFYDVLLSSLVTPFHVAAPEKALLPIKKDNNGTWRPLTILEILKMGRTAKNTFDEILKTASPKSPTPESLFDKLNTNRGKLEQQHVRSTGYLVVTGAGGKNVCAAFVEVSHFNPDSLILDQTLYWAQVDTADEAFYLTGLLNSDAISSIIKEFQPRGGFGERHIHKLPFGVTPPFDPEQAAHQDVVRNTKWLVAEYWAKINADPNIMDYLNANQGPLHWRRRALQNYIRTLSSYPDFEEACKALYGL